MRIQNKQAWLAIPMQILRMALNWSRDERRLLAAGMDGVLCVIAVWIAYSLRLGVWELFSRPLLTFAAATLLFWYPIAYLTGVYRSLIRFSGARTIANLAIACTILAGPLMIAFVLFRFPEVPRTLTILHPII